MTDDLYIKVHIFWEFDEHQQTQTQGVWLRSVLCKQLNFAANILMVILWTINAFEDITFL